MNYGEYIDEEYDEIFQDSLSMASIIRDNRILRQENEKLRAKVKDYENHIDEQFNQANKQLGNMLGSLMKL